MKRLAIIPARAGSKGLKDKNIIDLCGKPMIAYSIIAAKESGLFDKIIVSTDSVHYADISVSYGAEVILRDEELANDKATSFMVIEDVLKKLDDKYDYFVLLQPTSPLRTSIHIQEAISKFERNYDSFDFLVSMKKSEFTKDLVNMIDEDESLKYFDKDYSAYRRQSFSYYSPNGAIFLGKSEAYLKQKHFYGVRSLSYVMNDVDSVDVDYAIDYEFAKMLMSERMK
ncbi:acylneuraminate cytidylyltransferase family protein [Hoylesella shahii]|jgi:CMP-N-acetylneuraminic acid synthetase neuA|uniref:N-acylneuraminate cytidylyltransferase n=1 Tax=Hoylesella shahii DSM 15611 = JCM 12083 TaxID=1122991 RepID=A0A318HR46_9BACT|nr:acylneuraminate cytidylyltransferase family protein [Hoylesella shahii]PXX20858.1 N-acylneuraminate cytidylyltransferase [Hoylesella shahii DSM 15611 = JCM 12083]